MYVIRQVHGARSHPLQALGRFVPGYDAQKGNRLSASVLLTDLYELTMLQAYFEQRMNGPAVFELFVRKLPPRRNFLVAAGLAQVLEYLANLRFADDDLAWLRSSGRFTPDFVESLRTLRFTGDLDALPEGTVFFPDEPILRVSAPLREAQLVESRVMNLLHYETLVASKAARSVLAASGQAAGRFRLAPRPRRRGGVAVGTCELYRRILGNGDGRGREAVRHSRSTAPWPIPLSQAHADEVAAFEGFARAHPENAVLLIDTYDTERAAHKVVAPRIEACSRRHRDQGCAHRQRRSRPARAAGARDSRRGRPDRNHDLRERQSRRAPSARLVSRRAPIDGFGIGTRMNTSADAPYLDCAYKLQEYEGRPRRKRSEGKATWPGRKQVFRRNAPDGQIAGDVLALATENWPGTRLIAPVLRAGQPVAPAPALAVVRALAGAELGRLPERLRALDDAEPYPVEIAPELKRLAAEIDART